MQNQPRIDRILAGRSPVDIAHRIRIALADQRRQLLYHRDGQVPRRAGIPSEGLQVEQTDATRRRNRSRSSFRDHAHAAFRARQSRFKIKHALHSRASREDQVDGFKTEQWVEGFHEFSNAQPQPAEGVGVCRRLNRRGSPKPPQQISR